MIIHNMEECKQWIVRKQWYPILEQVLLFEPKINKYQYFDWHVVDICTKNFQHDMNRVMIDINKVLDNYPKLLEINDKIHIFMCPKPSVDTCNAIAGRDYICYFARSTQIIWALTDYITAHEFGHVVEDNFCYRRNNNSRFREYLSLRNAPTGLCNVWVDCDNGKDVNKYEIKEDFIFLEGTQEEKKKYHGDWDTNPAEWFAEDFRYLFGVDKGDIYWGLPIPPPDERIREFFMSL